MQSPRRLLTRAASPSQNYPRFVDRRSLCACTALAEKKPISGLKAACDYLAVSQSGSKAKLWKRIIATVARQRILEETQLSVPASTGHSIQPRSEQLAERPGSAPYGDYHSDSVGCIPLRGKSDSQHAVREMVKYLQYLGHGDICFPQLLQYSRFFKGLGSQWAFVW